VREDVEGDEGEFLRHFLIWACGCAGDGDGDGARGGIGPDQVGEYCLPEG
jgi:hypothetical protein